MGSMVVRLPAPGSVCLYNSPLPTEILPVLISVRDLVDSRAIVRSEGFYVNEKSTMTPSGNEPATFRIVAHHLNH